MYVYTFTLRGDPLSKFTDMRIPPLRIKSLLESNPLKSKLLVSGLGVMIIIVIVILIITSNSNNSNTNSSDAVRPVCLLRVRVSEGLTQANS